MHIRTVKNSKTRTRHFSLSVPGKEGGTEKRLVEDGDDKGWEGGG